MRCDICLDNGWRLCKKCPHTRKTHTEKVDKKKVDKKKPTHTGYCEE